jgi:ATP-dependent DNA helicase RecG
MNKVELEQRLKLNEWSDFEVKAAIADVPQDVWKTVSAFANTEGGTIIFGIRDLGDGQFEIAGVSNTEKIETDFLSTLRGEKFNIQLSSKGHLLDFDGKKVLAFRIDSMPRNCKPIYYGGDIRNTFMRQGSGDYKCSQEEIQRMLREASEYSSDSMVLNGFRMEDIDLDSVKSYRNFLAVRSPDNPFLGLNDEDLLLKLGCLYRERSSSSFSLTMAGLLLFGKEDSIRQRFPGYEFDIYLIRTPISDNLEIRWDDRQIFEQNLILTYIRAMEYLKSKVEIPFVLTGDHLTRTEEVPIVIALREALVNMLIHRDYFDNSQSRIKIYVEAIDMYNPGAAPKPVKDILENEVTAPRNPIIAKAFRMIGWAETAGSGMMKIFKSLETLKYPQPTIENNTRSSFFKMTFQLTPKNPTDQVPFKHRSSTDQVQVQKNILIICLSPHKLKDIMQATGFKHRPTFMSGYILPLLQDSLLAPTQPDKPRAPGQMYFTTEKGKKFINKNPEN